MFFKILLDRKMVCVLLIIFLIVLLTLVGCGKPSEKEVFELTLAHFQPPVHEVETVLIQGWIKAIEEATDGRVKITSYPGGTLIPGTEIYEGVVDGAADIGHSCYAYTRGRFPVLETLLVPGLQWPNAKVADWVQMDLIKELNPDELKDVKHLFSWTTGRGDLLTKVPVERKEDLSGLEIGVTAGERADALRRLGASGVVLPMPEQYEAISRGLTKGVVAPMETLKSFRLAEVVDHVTITPMLYNQLLFMVMNLDKWNSLPPDIQNIIEKVTEDYYEEVVAGFYDWLAELVFEWLAQEGIELEIIYLSKEEEERWVNDIKPLLDNHIKYLNDKGLPGQEIYNTTLKIIEKNTEIYGN
ncbi:MAG: TRAP transporter substrate-binding protein [Bacillota bacterium]|nr:TRAP transporter substrate-binding protein [Bacillota bacterium]